MHQVFVADALADMRVQLARLKALEAQLRKAILNAPAAVPAGRWARVKVVATTARAFDPALLSETVRTDPRYQREGSMEIIRTMPVQAMPNAPRPGWPIRWVTGASALH